MKTVKQQIDAIENLIHENNRKNSNLENMIEKLQDVCNHKCFTSFEDEYSIIEECETCGKSFEVSLTSQGDDNE